METWDGDELRRGDCKHKYKIGNVPTARGLGRNVDHTNQSTCLTTVLYIQQTTCTTCSMCTESGLHVDAHGISAAQYGSSADSVMDGVYLLCAHDGADCTR